MATAINYIEIRKNRRGDSRAFLLGTRIRVFDVYVLSEVQGKSADEIVRAFPQLSLAQVHAALAYYFDNMEAIHEEARADEEFLLRMRSANGPGPLEKRLNRADAEGDTFSP